MKLQKGNLSQLIMKGFMKRNLFTRNFVFDTYTDKLAPCW